MCAAFCQTNIPFIQQSLFLDNFSDTINCLYALFKLLLRYWELLNWNWTLKLKETQNINVFPTNSISNIWYSLIVRLYSRYKKDIQICYRPKQIKEVVKCSVSLDILAIYSCNIDLYVYLVHSYVVVRLPQVLFYSIFFLSIWWTIMYRQFISWFGSNCPTPTISSKGHFSVICYH